MRRTGGVHVALQFRRPHQAFTVAADIAKNTAQRRDVVTIATTNVDHLIRFLEAIGSAKPPTIEIGIDSPAARSAAIARQI